MNDPFDLRRFVDAQAQVYQRVVTELGRGQKQSHWMWFIFPQFAGLGFSAMVQRFAIASRDEAVAYLRHDVLGPRLLECTRLVNSVEGKTIRQIFGKPRRSQIPLVDDAVCSGVSRTRIPCRARQVLRRRGRSQDARTARPLALNPLSDLHD